ncbi:putative dehydrogenase [Azorhizobium caulinodans ORS 571]|uniref:Putative dehydrogenase n=1 Tax=Azorhizobium caulinodans (strain ATCC 43989 / DSM 5975 / JCM 20966 / LMG 6465 / NBRC 14845 / NCIMB 13405 / ORS 571) TaxID=438753 RepID=A8IE98_AZOC5|nr:glyoxylate/hydroxypyruvate reductase A [Azorhizobium caulinodans]BAF89463.1 putative dehydrogenase [Azorhizobium caulinodans ORS 571]
MRESLVFYSPADVAADWLAAIGEHLPGLDMHIATREGAPCPAEDVHYAVVWKPPQDFFKPFTNLKLVVNLGAGVDALVSRTDLPDVPITRLSDPEMSKMMAGFVLMCVLRHARDIVAFERIQKEGRWRYIHPTTPDRIRVGVMGLGELGATAAHEIARFGYPVKGWSRTPKALPGIECHHGLEALPQFLAQTDILVVMLPLTPETRHIVNAERLAMLPKGAKFINVARGPIVDEPALVAALQSGHISEASLDVFEEEPLPEASPLWGMDNVLITPHLASIALPRSAAAQIAENIRRIRAGQPVLNRVDPSRGY